MNTLAKDINHHIGLRLLETARLWRKRLTYHTKSTQRILERQPTTKEKHQHPDQTITHTNTLSSPTFFYLYQLLNLNERVLSYIIVFLYCIKQQHNITKYGG